MIDPLEILPKKARSTKHGISADYTVTEEIALPASIICLCRIEEVNIYEKYFNQW
ncbi:hypothetical protein PHOSAC3_120568 [Mesotoga infera]|nr:hypothetical protein PHOSAC3_120568 [Mesotoga infera]